MCYFVVLHSTQTSVEIVSIIAVCWDAMMHAGIALNPPLGIIVQSKRENIMITCRVEEKSGHTLTIEV